MADSKKKEKKEKKDDLLTNPMFRWGKKYADEWMKNKKKKSKK